MVSFNQLARMSLQADTSPVADALCALTQSCVAVLEAWAAEQAGRKRTVDGKALLGSVSVVRARGLTPMWTLKNGKKFMSQALELVRAQQGQVARQSRVLRAGALGTVTWCSWQTKLWGPKLQGSECQWGPQGGPGALRASSELELAELCLLLQQVLGGGSGAGGERY